MLHATPALVLAASGRAPIWIAGWIVVLLIVIGVPIYLARHRGKRPRE